MGHDETHRLRAWRGGGDAPGPDDDAPVVPPEEKLLDPRAIGRASLAVGRNASLWWVAAGVGLAAGVAQVAGTGGGALVLAALLAVSALVRAVRPTPGPVALVVRSQALDVTVLFVLALGVAILSQAIPTH